MTAPGYLCPLCRAGDHRLVDCEAPCPLGQLYGYATAACNGAGHPALGNTLWHLGRGIVDLPLEPADGAWLAAALPRLLRTHAPRLLKVDQLRPDEAHALEALELLRRRCRAFADFGAAAGAPTDESRRPLAGGGELP